MTALGDQKTVVPETRSPGPEVTSERPVDPARTLANSGSLTGAVSPDAMNGARGDGLIAHFDAAALGVSAEHEGRYAVEGDGELGRGGIGRVYVAVDRHLARRVAVKELLSEGADSEPSLPALARFLREARITGKLDHPNIVPVYELGRRADGSLYYTMRVVRGRTLSRALSEAHTLGERLKLLDHFIGLSQAIAYAHSRGVVHRDIKPDNVMIGEFGETVVLDWGIAKARGDDTSEGGEGALPLARFDPLALDLTLDGSVFGTPSHMSPEQARGAINEVDERSDVWALGVVLYTILSGRLPFEGKDLLELILRIRGGQHEAPGARDPRVPAELSAIAEHALRRDPSERYPSGKELLRDVEAYRSGARVGAYEYSSLELLRRFLERHRTWVVATAVGLGVAMVLAVASYLRVATARDRAREAEHRATKNAEEARESEQRAKQSLGEALVERAQQAKNDADWTSAALLAAEALTLVERADARGLAVAAENAVRPEPIGAPLAPGCTRYAVSFAANTLACAQSDGILLYGLHDGAPKPGTLAGGSLRALEFSGDGTRLLSAKDDGTVSVFRLTADGATPAFEHRVSGVSAAAVSTDGRYVSSGGASGEVVVWDVERPNREWRLPLGQGVSALSFAPDAASLSVGGELGRVILWDFEHGRSRSLSDHTGTVRALVFAQQGRYLASGGADHTIRFWDTRDGKAVSSPIVHSDAITSLTWSADGRLLAFGSKDKTLHLLDLKNPERRAEVRYHDDAVDRVALGEGGTELASASHDLGLVLWSLASQKTPATLVEHGNVLSFAFVPGGNELVSAGLGAEGVGIFDVAAGVCRTRLPAGVDRIRTLAVSGDGKRLAFAGSSARVFLWDLPARVPLRVFDSPKDEVRAVAFSSDNRWLAFAGLDHTVRVTDATTFAAVAELAASGPVQALAFSPTNGVLLEGARDGTVTLWDVAAKRPTLRIRAHEDALLAIAVSPDGSVLASTGADRHVKLFSSKDGTLLFDLTGHEGKVLSLAFSDDGNLLASGAEDKTVRLWDPASGRELAELNGHTGAVRAVHFAPGRPLLASSSDDGTIRLWHLENLSTPGAALRKRVEARFHVELLGTRVVRSKP